MKCAATFCQMSAGLTTFGQIVEALKTPIVFSPLSETTVFVR